MGEVRERVVLDISTTGAQAESRALEATIVKLLGSLDKLVTRLGRAEDSQEGLADAEREVQAQSTRTLRAHEREAAALDRVDKSADRARRSIRDIARGYGEAGAATRNMLVPLTRIAALLGAGLGLRSVVTDLATFERGLTQVRTIAAATDEELANIKRTAIQLGATTPKSASEAVQGAVTLARAGFSGRDIPEALPGVLQLSVTAELDLARAADIAANSIRQFGLEADDTTRITDALTTAANAANTDVNALAEALGFAGPLASAFGLDIEETVAALSAISDGGIKASRAGTGLAGVLRRLVKPSEDAAEAFGAVGVNLRDLDPRYNDFADVVERLGIAYRRGADLTKVFEAEQLAAAIVLAQLDERFATVLEKQRASVDAAGDLSAAYGSDLQGKLTTFQSTLDGVTKKLGDEGLTGALGAVIDFGTDTVRSLFHMEQGLGRFGAAADIAASAVEGLVIAFGVGAVVRFGSALVAAINPLTLLAAGIGGVVAASSFYSRSLDEMAKGTEQLSDSAERAGQQVEKLAERLAKIDELGGAHPRTDQTRLTVYERQLGILQEAARSFGAQLREALDPKESFDTIDAFRAKLEALRGRADATRTVIEGIYTKARLDPSTVEDPITKDDYYSRAGASRPAFENVALRKGQFETALAELRNFEAQAAKVGKDRLVPTGVLDQIAERAGLTDELRDAESKAAAGFIKAADAERILAESQRYLNEERGHAIQQIEKLREEQNKPPEKPQAEVQVVSVDAFRRGTQAIKDETVALLNQQDVVRSGLANGRSLDDVLRDVTDRREEHALALELERQLTNENVKVTEGHRSELRELAHAYVAAKREAEDFAAAQREAAAGAKAEDQQREKQARQEERYALAQGQRLEQLEGNLRMERAAYTRTRQEVERLQLAEDLRYSGADDRTAERLRALQAEAQQLRDLRELGDSAAGGFGDVLRAAKDGATGREALQAGLQGTIDRVFQASTAKLEEQLGAVFTSGLAGLFGTGGGAVPGATPGETAIVQAVQRVEAAVISTGGVGGDGGPGGTNTTATTGFDWSGLATSVAAAGITLGLSLLLNRDRGDRERDSGAAGFGVRDPRGGTTVVQNNRTTINASGAGGREIARTVRQVQADQRRRWSGRR